MLPEALTPSPAVILLLVTLPLFFAPKIIRAFTSSAGPIYHLLRTASQQDVELPCTPTRRFSSLITVVFSITLLGLKHLGLGPTLGKIREDGRVELPALSVSAPMSIRSGDISAYQRAVSPGSPLTIPAATTSAPLLLLAPLTTPLIPSLLLLRANPIRPLGSVNTRNIFIFHRPDVLHQAGSMGPAKDGGMKAEARMGGSGSLGRRVKRGVEFDTVITVKADGEAVFSFTFTTLSLLRLPPSAPYYQAKPSEPTHTPEPSWSNDPLPLSLPSDSAPLLWASLSKDYNPIHVSPLLAKLFGFKRSIAHGNMVLAMAMQRAISSTEEADGDAIPARAALGQLWAGASDRGAEEPSWLVVDFKRPVFVPSAPRVRWSKGRVQVYDAGPKRQSGESVDTADEVRVLVDIRAGEGGEAPARVLLG